MKGSRQVLILRFVSALANMLPVRLSGRIAGFVGRRLASRIGGFETLRRNLARVGSADPNTSAARGIGAYATYWVDTLNLPTLPARQVDRRFSFIDYHHILDVQHAGVTPIMVLPHLGSWEWAAAWLGRVDGQHVVAVVEKLEPPEVFEWFRQTRQSYGVEVVPLGPEALKLLMARVRANDSIICLLADRDIAGNGVTVDFFGQMTAMPAGPALLSLRTGSPLLPVAIYDRGDTRECRVGAPLWPERRGTLKQDIARITQDVACHLEPLITHAPDQWHVLSDVWGQESAGAR